MSACSEVQSIFHFLPQFSSHAPHFTKPCKQVQDVLPLISGGADTGQKNTQIN